MDNKYELLKKIINNCDIEFDGSIVSKESLMKGYYEFLSSTINSNDHNVGVILHTGSVCFDIISIIFSAIYNVIVCDNNPEDVITSIKKDDIVIYNGKRYKYLGIEVKINTKYAKLCQPNNYNLTNYVRNDSWYKIEPYKGDSETLDGRGIRNINNSRSSIISRLLDINENDIPSICDKSSVMVMSRKKADFILNKLFITLDDFKVGILDITTVSYFSENDEYQYSGNPGKTEPNIKITSKISVARDLILDKTGNKIIGLFVFDNINIENGKTELLELMNRKSLNYVFTACNIASGDMRQVIDEYTDTKVFACTREYLMTCSNKIISNNKLTNELNHQINIIIGKKVKSRCLTSESCWHDIDEIKSSLVFMKNTDFSNDNKEIFIKSAYSLLKLFSTVPFPINVMENMIENNELETRSPKLRLEELYKLSEQFPNIIKIKSDYVVEQLKKIYDFISNDATKYEFLKYLIEECKGGPISVIVQKEYYIKVLDKMGLNLNKVIVSTANKFDNSKIYNKVFIIGNIEEKKFNPFRCSSSNRIHVIIYDFEQEKFNYLMRKADDINRIYNLKSGLIENNDDNGYELNQIVLNDHSEKNDLDFELELYISQINQLDASSFITKVSQNNVGMLTDIIAIGSFTDGGKALFTKSYRAYVFNFEKEEVKEVDVDKLSVGDTLIFTKNNNVTKDIVDYILNKLASSKSFSTEHKKAHFYAKLWKDVLKNFKEENNLTYEELALRFRKIGIAKHVVTIRSWLDDDLHIVGPKDIESYEAIGELTNNKLIKSDPKKIQESCDIIRKIRVSILKKIGQSIINKLSGHMLPEDDSILQIVYENVNDLAVMLQLESITYVDYQVPINLINRPLDL